VRGETPSDFFYKNDLRQIQESAFLWPCWMAPSAILHLLGNGLCLCGGQSHLGYLDDSRIYDPNLQLNP